MVDSGRFVLLYQLLGAVDDVTGEPINMIINNPLENATLSLKELAIRKHTVQRALACENATAVDTETLEEAKVLQKLVESNATNEGLAETAKEFNALANRNAILKECFGLFQSIEARYPGGSIRFRLDAGSLYNIAGDLVWLMQPLADENSTVPVEYLGCMRIHLAGVPWSSPTNPLNFQQPEFSESGRMYLKYSSFIKAVFAFDDSLENFDLETYNPLEHVTTELMRSAGWIAQGDGAQEREESGLTMKFVGFHVGFSVVQSHLDLLGVDVDMNEV